MWCIKDERITTATVQRARATHGTHQTPLGSYKWVVRGCLSVGCRMLAQAVGVTAAMVDTLRSKGGRKGMPALPAEATGAAPCSALVRSKRMECANPNPNPTTAYAACPRPPGHHLPGNLPSFNANWNVWSTCSPTRTIRRVARRPRPTKHRTTSWRSSSSAHTHTHTHTPRVFSCGETARQGTHATHPCRGKSLEWRALLACAA